MKDTREEQAKKLGAIKKVEVESEGGNTYTFFFKKPHRHVLGLAFAKLDVNPVEANEIMINNCVIKEVSDAEQLNDDSVFFALMPHLSDLMIVKKSTSTML
jgi:hypothetical protein